jgi:hypothetical protein
LKSTHHFSRIATAIAIAGMACTAVAQTPLESAGNAAPVNANSAAPDRGLQAHEKLGRSARSLIGSRAEDLNPDELEAAIADRVPGFAGIVYRKDGKGGIDENRPIARMAARSGLFDGNVLKADWRRIDSPAANGVKRLAADVSSQAAQWDSRELLTYKKAAFALASTNGLMSAWIDREANRVELVYNRKLDAAGVQALSGRLEAAGVQMAAVVLRPGEPMSAQAQIGVSVQNQQQPLSGGSQFQFNTTRGGFNCSVGVPATLNGTLGFVTASHCSERVYDQSVSTDTFAPTLSSTFLGTESFDPQNFSCSLPDSLGCRESDAMFVEAAAGADSVELGRILLTNVGSLTVTGTINVIGHSKYPAVGKQVSKTGRTTGTRSATIARVCQDTLVNAGYGTYGALCSIEVDNPSFSAGGDSGSAIWIDTGNGARVAGVLSYGNGFSTGFSPWGGVLKEIGKLKLN